MSCLFNETMKKHVLKAIEMKKRNKYAK